MYPPHRSRTASICRSRRARRVRYIWFERLELKSWMTITWPGRGVFKPRLMFHTVLVVSCSFCFNSSRYHFIKTILWVHVCWQTAGKKATTLNGSSCRIKLVLVVTFLWLTNILFLSVFEDIPSERFSASQCIVPEMFVVVRGTHRSCFCLGFCLLFSTSPSATALLSWGSQACWNQ